MRIAAEKKRKLEEERRRKHEEAAFLINPLPGADACKSFVADRSSSCQICQPADQEIRKWEEKRMRREEEMQRRAEKVRAVGVCNHGCKKLLSQAAKQAAERKRQREEEKARLREDSLGQQRSHNVSAVDPKHAAGRETAQRGGVSKV